MPAYVAPEQSVRRLPVAVVNRMAMSNTPDASGAMGRNRAGYFHVRFQLGLTSLADQTLATQNPQGAEQLLRALQYSLSYQQPAGDFQLVIPSNLTYLGTPAPGDVASGVAFFLSSAGWALHVSLQDPLWQQTGFAAYRQEMVNQLPAWRKAATWLADQQGLLKQYDAQAPNRLFYDAVAYYSFGRVLDDPALRGLGVEFAALALAQQHPDGYFLEGGGWDSSYNGVNITVGMRLYLLLPENDPLRPRLWAALARAVAWQSTRILPSGEISTQGNTRVYPGGETFLGEEKQVAAATTWEAFHWFAALGNEPCYRDLTTRLEQYYR